MAAHQTSPPQISQRKNLPAIHRMWSMCPAWLAHFIQFACHKIHPWCKDHAVSVVVLLACPLVIGVFYWTRPSTEPAPLPGYRKLDRINAPNASDVPVSVAAPEMLPLASTTGGDAVSPPPLPIADAPAPISRAKEGPILPWPGRALSVNPTENSLPQIVWLSGLIEPVEATPDLLQNASRVHELTLPYRN